MTITLQLNDNSMTIKWQFNDNWITIELQLTYKWITSRLHYAGILLIPDGPKFKSMAYSSKFAELCTDPKTNIRI